MLRDKLMIFAMMSIVAGGALVPTIPTNAAKVGNGDTVGEFNIDSTIQEKLTLDTVPNLYFKTIRYFDIKEGDVSSTLQTTREATANDDLKFQITDTRKTNRNWSLMAKMTNFTDGEGNMITIDNQNLGIGLIYHVPVTGTLLISRITDTMSPVASHHPVADMEIDNLVYDIYEYTRVHLDRNSTLPVEAAGNTFTSDITWVLNDTW